jgi:leader peptidase (prepilin peptidase)/N-methyltransferase
LVALIAAFAGLLGLAVGSFLNVVAYRVPEGRSVVAPPSACPACDTPIAPRDNVPVLSWILLGGKCRTCQAPISVRYPIVEAATGLLFVATTLIIGLQWDLPAHLWFVAVTVTLVLTDLDHHRIPNRILFPGTIVGVVLLAVGGALEGRLDDVAVGLLAGALNFVLFLLIALAARGGFGMGDVKLAFILGVFTGYHAWTSTVVAAFLAFLIGGAVSLVLLALRSRGRKDAIAFGPPMILGAWIAIAWGVEIMDWYLA